MTPEIPMDALRVIAERHKNPANDAQAIVEHTAAISAVAAYVEAVDAQAAAAKDEALANKLRCLYLSNGFARVPIVENAGRKAWIEIARIARAHIAKEQGQ